MNLTLENSHKNQALAKAGGCRPLSASLFETTRPAAVKVSTCAMLVVLASASLLVVYVVIHQNQHQKHNQRYGPSHELRKRSLPAESQFSGTKTRNININKRLVDLFKSPLTTTTTTTKPRQQHTRGYVKRLRQNNNINNDDLSLTFREVASGDIQRPRQAANRSEVMHPDTISNSWIPIVPPPQSIPSQKPGLQRSQQQHASTAYKLRVVFNQSAPDASATRSLTTAVRSPHRRHGYRRQLHGDQDLGASHHHSHYHRGHQHSHHREYSRYEPPIGLPQNWRASRYQITQSTPVDPKDKYYDDPHHNQHNQNYHYERYPRRSKSYLRVLLCDKTLVSLEYIRRNAEPHESRPTYNFGDDDINFNSMYELDSAPTPEIVASLSSQPFVLNATSTISSTSTPTSTTSTALNTTTTTTTTTKDNNETVTSEFIPAAASNFVATNSIERRSGYFLSDEDPLVKCDMWDLEKGLSSRKPPKEIMHMAVKADFDTVRDAINRCRHLTEKSLPIVDEYRDNLEITSEDLLSLVSMKRGLIPGTKWCGLGDQASSYNDLGQKHRIDICCRAHDHCPIRLKPFRNDYGVLNIAFYTKSHCDCDADFYKCLREAHSRTADMLGNLYFNVMKLQCIREERRKVCLEIKPIALGFERCVKYEDSPRKTIFRFSSPTMAY